MRFEWNQVKNRANVRKHKLSFEIACLVFDDPHHLSIQDQTVDEEIRWQTLGMVDGIVLVIVAHTVDEDESITRIISARKATRIERQIYEHAYKKTTN
jgi:uncharacterized DUF497 family protein